MVREIEEKRQMEYVVKTPEDTDFGDILDKFHNVIDEVYDIIIEKLTTDNEPAVTTIRVILEIG